MLEANQASVESQPPQRKMWLIVIGIVAVFVILVVIIVTAIFLLRRTSQPLPKAASPSPAALRVASPVPDNTLNPQSSAPIAPQPSAIINNPQATVGDREPQTSIVVKVNYERKERFSLQITSIHRTYEIPTISFVAPSANQPHSLLQLLSADGKKIAEYPFTVNTQVSLEQGGDFSKNSFYQLPKSELDMIIPVKNNIVPAIVRLANAQGETLDEEKIDYSKLVEDKPIPDARVRAATSASQFTVAIINEQFDPAGSAAGTLNSTNAAIQKMASTINPWPNFPVNTVVINNNQPLGCQAIAGPSGYYPACPNAGSVIRVVQEKAPNWNAIIVVYPGDCDCGTAYLGSQIVSVGTRADYELLAHELGHSIAALADEYYYQFNGNAIAGPNCFASMRECEEANEPFKDNPDAVCSPGCNNNQTVRPATLIMHSSYGTNKYGPFEECVMGKAIAGVLSQEYTCGEDQGDLFWGGHS